MPRGFTYGGESLEGVTDRELAGRDLERKRRFQPLPDTLTASTRRTIEAANRARQSRPSTPPRPPAPPPPVVPTTTVVPGTPPTPPENTVIINNPFGGGGYGGSGPTSPTFPGGGFFPTGGGGGIGDALRGGLGTLINRGVNRLGDELFGGSEPPSSNPTVPGGGGSTLVATGGGGDCPGIGSIKVMGKCVNLGDLGPGGAPAITPQVGGDWNPVLGLYGAGVTPMVEERIHRSCPPGFVLGKDGVCYDGLAKSKRKWNPGRKPLLTGGEMAAIAKAKRAAGRIKRAQKGLKKAGRALEKVG